MILRKGYRFQLKPTTQEKSLLRQFVGCARFVWNAVLSLNELLAEHGEKRFRYSGMCSYLVHLKAENEFLRDAPSQPLQQALRDLDLAYSRAFDKKLPARMPHKKYKGRPAGIRFPQGFRVNGSGVFLPKIGWIGFRKSREIEGTIKNITVSHDGVRWYVSMQTEREIPDPVHPSTSEIGIDLGVNRFAACSDGTFLEGSNSFQKHQSRLALLQGRMAKKNKYSANWWKARLCVTRLQRKIKDTRGDMLNKASTTISKSHAVVVMEDLRITNMTASAKGTIEEPGTRVSAKSGLNRRVLDQGWGEFRRQLGYKLEWLGGILYLVDPKNTSRTCAECGHVSADNRQTQAEFRCVGCGHSDHADTNAAINILRRAGHAQIACGDAPLGASMKQEAQLVA